MLEVLSQRFGVLQTNVPLQFRPASLQKQMTECNETQRKRGLDRFKTITDRDVGAKDKCYIGVQGHIRNTRANPIIVPPCVNIDPQRNQ